MVRCKYMEKGRRCPWGCREGEKPLCHNHVRGRCNYGPYCRRRHVTPSTHTELDPELPAHGQYSVTLVSAGWSKEGWKYIENWMPNVDFKQLAHRVVLVFDSTDHLNWWGTDPNAQKQFMKLYPDCKQYFVALEPYIRKCTFKSNIAHMCICVSGHHRSPCFVELFARWLTEKHPQMRINKWHLDHTWKRSSNGERVWNLEHFLNLNQNDQEDFLEGPLVEAIWAMRDKPLNLLHRLPRSH